MAEWSNAAVSKTVVRLPANRGFESPSLRKASTSFVSAGLLRLCQLFLHGSPKAIHNIHIPLPNPSPGREGLESLIFEHIVILKNK
jgi:hypothetical protein